MITTETITVIHLTNGKNVAVQGIIGAMAKTKEWYYYNGRILRNIVVEGKRRKESLQRYLCSIKTGEKATVRCLDKKEIEIHGHTCINFLADNLQVTRRN